jgi:hypothetical protein
LRSVSARAPTGLDEGRGEEATPNDNYPNDREDHEPGDELQE